MRQTQEDENLVLLFLVAHELGSVC